MNDLVRGTWDELRERRLWPIAIALAIAIFAIPVLLTKSSAAPPAPDPVASTADVDDRVAVKLDGGDAASTGTGSSLDGFAEGDPFTPPGAIAASAGAGASATASLAGPSSSAGGGGGSGAPGAESPGSTSPNAPTTPAPPTTRTETTEYQYVADVTFWSGDRRRKISGLRKLDMLPNQSAPVLIFMGTSEEGGNAVFLVDSTLKAVGEGRCVPSPSNCAYVHIGAGAEHSFSTEDGDSYRLRVDEIRRVKAGASTSAKSRPSARTSVGDGMAVKRFQLPSLVDLVAESTTKTIPVQGRSSVPEGGR